MPERTFRLNQDGAVTIGVDADVAITCPGGWSSARVTFANGAPVTLDIRGDHRSIFDPSLIVNAVTNEGADMVQARVRDRGPVPMDIEDD